MAEHAVVTGVSSGIGAAIATRLLDEGWRVTGISRTAPPHAHDRLRWLPADLARPEELPQALTPMDEDGPLDALVHAAGVQRAARLANWTPRTGPSCGASTSRRPPSWRTRWWTGSGTAAGWCWWAAGR
ncbi:SDR family oxidoreductase [Streptomyces himastatinicus]|uniref:SDR family oxidoreductase n=1 Tax=Streptomyces himastatinicus TaxID=998084 RepID=UPI001FE1CBE8|nr:SDR family oxidoreductase [Streptomyces himastatinicus]